MSPLTWSPWWWRAAVALVLWAGCLVAGSALAMEPDAVRLLVLVCLLIGWSGLLADSVVEPGPDWHVDHPGREDWRGHDQRTAFYVRMIESHLTGRPGDPTVRDRLVRLAEQTLRVRHGAEPGAAGAGERLDADLDRLARQPAQPMSREELDQWIGRIERL